jgi:hypothetical protein
MSAIERIVAIDAGVRLGPKVPDSVEEVGI